MEKKFLEDTKKTLRKYMWAKKFYKFSKRVIKPFFIYKTFNSTKPISNVYGTDRGQSIDRFYIENFLKNNSSIIKGRTLEILDNKYTKNFGDKKVIQSDVLDIDKKNSDANIIADLRNMPEIKENTYDCIILTQVLQFIDNLDQVISECHRILKPGGYILATMPSLSRIDCAAGIENDFWRFTQASAKYIFAKKFNDIVIKTYGNSRVGACFLYGASVEDTPLRVLKKNDNQFPVVITVKARKHD